MARVLGRLTALKVEKLKEAGMYADGGGLYLRVTKDGTKNWVFRFMLNKRPRWMGLGPVALFGLQEARGRALDARRLRHDGVDPIETRRASRIQQRLEAAKAISFDECCSAYIKANRAGWRNAKHGAQWESTLATYASPVVGALPVQTIDTGLVLKVLEPIWADKPETASRVRQRIERVLDWARVRGYRTGENPARWKGHLDKLLPATAKVRRVVHHAALPYGEMPGFLADLRQQEGVAARALEFLVLTAGRTGEVIGARWTEVNRHDKTWQVPGERMKAGREHRVPLSARALAILEETYALRHADDGFLFPGAKHGKPLSNMAFLMLLRRMSRDDLTAHGFRSSFRDWVAERTNFPAEVAEIALAHTVSDKTVAAYSRTDLFERRRRLMQQWSVFCTAMPQEKRGNVTALSRPQS
ncbi:site-specific integrase [Bradyrhizobium sp. BTAi1]|uniref:tyrosine-type recombinase/integrase n=1 Tax=Bradyrhizobium sp. (strain BTAi1 / ATCC BAA-1182) TaxID=288000 RepID=UPI0005A215F0|nr:site-specific integrase [Bradyrhizobium sp. BTAi1]